MVCALPGAFLPCADDRQYDHYHDGSIILVIIIMMIMIIMVVIGIIVVVIIILLIEVIKILLIEVIIMMNMWLLGIRGSLNVIKCAVLTLEIIWVQSPLLGGIDEK